MKAYIIWYVSVHKLWENNEGLHWESPPKYQKCDIKKRIDCAKIVERTIYDILKTSLNWNFEQIC